MKLKIDNIYMDFEAFIPAIRGMRNPMNSWNKIDTKIVDGELIIGDNDLDLMLRLVKAGLEHRKFLRMLTFSVDLYLPLYMWSQFDTYKIGTVANSTSKMHKIHTTKIQNNTFNLELNKDHFTESELLTINQYISLIEDKRQEYNTTKDKAIWNSIIQLLPESFIQMRTVHMNYETALNIINQRENHKLSEEWGQLIKTFFDELPLLKKFQETIHPKSEAPKKVVFLDAGHGLDTQGKETPPIPQRGDIKIKERAFNQMLMEKVCEKLRNADKEMLVINISGSKLIDRKLSERVDIVNKNCVKYKEAKKALVSIHHNASSDVFDDVTGVETYIYEGSEEGLSLASAININISPKYKDRGIKTTKSFAIVKNTTCPAVLFEGLFMNGRDDIKVLLDEEFVYYDDMSDAIVKGILSYMD